MAKNRIINKSIYLRLPELNFDEVLAANRCVFGWLPLFALPGDGDTSSGTNPQFTPLWVFRTEIGRSIYDSTTTTRYFGQTKLVPKKMYQGGVPLWANVKWKLWMEQFFLRLHSCSIPCTVLQMVSHYSIDRHLVVVMSQLNVTMCRQRPERNRILVRNVNIKKVSTLCLYEKENALGIFPASLINTLCSGDK